MPRFQKMLEEVFADGSITIELSEFMKKITVFEMMRLLQRDWRSDGFLKASQTSDDDGTGTMTRLKILKREAKVRCEQMNDAELRRVVDQARERLEVVLLDPDSRWEACSCTDTADIQTDLNGGI